jgi:hypothetical protein
MPIPMAGPMAPGMGPPPIAGLPPGALDALKNLQETPAPAGETQALAEATMKIGMALQRIYLRSPKASKLLADALAKVQQAREELEKNPGGGAQGPPPNLLGGMTPAPMGGMGGPMAPTTL